MTAYGGLERKLVGELESRIGEVCRAILASRKPVCIYPNESTVFPLSTSMSTLPSLPGSRPVSPTASTPATASGWVGPRQHTFAVIPAAKPVATISDRPARPPSREQTAGLLALALSSDPAKGEVERIDKDHESNSDRLDGTPRSEVNVNSLHHRGTEMRRRPSDDQVTDGIPHERAAEASKASETGKDEENADIIDLVRPEQSDGPQRPTNRPRPLVKGVVAVCRLDHDQLPPRYTAGLLTVIPEFEQSLGRARTIATRELHLEWLTDEEARKVTRARLKVTDVQTMDDTADIDSGSPDSVILQHGHAMLRMNIVRS